MCIAIASERGVKVPSKKYLQNCFENNDDGAGFAFAYNGKVTIIKGLMTFDDFWKTFSRYNSKYNFKNLGVLIHFRIQTHGGVCPECTHPFPLTEDDDDLKKVQITSDYAVVHNGIISLTSFEARKENKMSDTMVFIRDYLYPLSTNKSWFKNSINWELIYRLAESKIAVLNSNGDIQHTEGFTKDKDGNLYSNGSYRDDYYKSYYTAKTTSVGTGLPASNKYPDYTWIDDDDYYENYYDRYYSSLNNKSYSSNNAKKEETLDDLQEFIPLMIYTADQYCNLYDPICEDATTYLYDGRKKSILIDENNHMYATVGLKTIKVKGKDGLEYEKITSPVYRLGTGEFLDSESYMPSDFIDEFVVDHSNIKDFDKSLLNKDDTQKEG